MKSAGLTFDYSELRDLGGVYTAQEIIHQPEKWRQAALSLEANRADINCFLTPVLAKDNLRIIFTGAGSSAFAGNIIAPYLAKLTRRRFEAISSTNILAAPDEYFSEQTPTLLVSFARSGNSPESVAVVELARQLLPEFSHLVLTCNPEGQLTRTAAHHDNTFCQLMPEGTNDKSFAMTSSFSTMLLSALCIFDDNPANAEKVEQVSGLAEQLLQTQAESLKNLAKQPASRFMFLGSGCLQGLARESALKLLELTAGKVVAVHESPLGVRHGPKFMINNKTIVFQFMASEPYTRCYDMDLLYELQRDNNAMDIIPITSEIMGDGRQLLVEPKKNLESIWLSFPFIVLAQMFVFFKSLKLGVTPDNPCPTGEVNRVVQGVRIHPFTQQIRFCGPK